MPTYVYKAMTDKGLIIRNRVESGSRQQLIKSLKNNELLPISIEQVAYRNNNRRKKEKEKCNRHRRDNEKCKYNTYRA